MALRFAAVGCLVVSDVGLGTLKFIWHLATCCPGQTDAWAGLLRSLCVALRALAAAEFLEHMSLVVFHVFSHNDCSEMCLMWLASKQVGFNIRHLGILLLPGNRAAWCQQAPVQAAAPRIVRCAACLMEHCVLEFSFTVDRIEQIMK